MGKIISFVLITMALKNLYAVFCDIDRESRPIFEEENLSRFFRCVHFKFLEAPVSSVIPLCVSVSPHVSAQLPLDRF
jgi:hypothetical protein